MLGGLPPPPGHVFSWNAPRARGNSPLVCPEERFRPDGWFATGDEYLQDPDGFYHHRGRTDDMLRVSGIWFSPAEIEDVLAPGAFTTTRHAVIRPHRFSSAATWCSGASLKFKTK